MDVKFGGSRLKPQDNAEEQFVMPSMANIETSGNHIYFYDDVDEGTILKLNKLIRDMSTALLIQSQNGLAEPCIYLHINSGGGSVLDAFAAVDTILSCPVTVITIVEGCAASAATLISIAGGRRLIHRHSHMLIHQLSSGFWGKHDEFEDEMQNLNSFMKMIKEFYKQYTLVPPKNLDEILKHDIYLTSAQCVTLGLVDGIIDGGGGKRHVSKPKPKAKKSGAKKPAKKPEGDGSTPAPKAEPEKPEQKPEKKSLLGRGKRKPSVGDVPDPKK